MKKYLTSLIALTLTLGVPLSAWAAITLDGTVVTSQNTASNAITVASNSNRMGIVTFTTYQGGAPSGITWAGTSMVKVAEMIGSFGENSSIWSIVAPATGTNNVVISGAASFYAVGVYSLYNVDQNTPATTNTGGGDSGTETLSLTTDTANSWVIGSLEAEPLQTMTTTNGVEDWNQSGASYQHGEGQHIVTTTAGSYTVSASLAYGSRWNETLAQIKPVAAATAINPPLTIASKTTFSGKTTIQ